MKANPTRADPLAVTTDDVTLLKLTRLILQEINKRGKIIGHSRTKEEIAGEADMPISRVNALMNPVSQKAKEFSLSDIRKVVRFAKRYAESLSDEDFHSSLLKYTRELTERISAYIEKPRDGGDDSTYALGPIEQLVKSQIALSVAVRARYCKPPLGAYLLIRFDAKGRLVIARMDVFELRKDNAICRFRTIRHSKAIGERITEGYIYQFDDHVYAVGQIDGTGAIRCSILNPRNDGSGDMFGLRLGISDLDSGPFAYRLYCRYLGRGDDATTTSLIKTMNLNETTLAYLNRHIPIIEDIIELLRAPPDSPYGLQNYSD